MVPFCRAYPISAPPPKGRARPKVACSFLGCAKSMGCWWFAATLSLLLAASVAGSWLDGDDGVDRAYGDLPNMPIEMNSSALPSDCAKLCEGESKCVAWAYCKPNCSSNKTPLCYQKAEVMPQTANPCRVRYFWLLWRSLD